ncbi:MAG: flagellar motor protein MotA, partial [Alphaproteobacteria bacterium]|nr:flagellar motor protein MotA [Alphaproteobacteria bacterium]
GSLVLGFLDLKASQAQNRFYHNLEDWLSTITDVQAGDHGGSAMPAYLRLDLQNLQGAIDRLGHQMSNRPATASGAPAGNENATEQLADAVANLVQQMREEQKMVRQWIQSQQVQQSEIQRLLIRSTGKG